uniref:Suppressor of disruption of TFIIS n=1 Tax=Ananas comosus var. bracteatus TaxID=296719 RepID=A0A6V7PNX7_ANACO|nr:unnamed protein product [Ananas comosus var. bracteatus]
MEFHDLDDTCILHNCIAGACKHNIEEFLAKKCGVSAKRAHSLRVEHFRNYGSSLAGSLHSVTTFIQMSIIATCTETLPYEQIAPDPQLVKLLRSIPQPKILFTNSDQAHVQKVLKRLSVDEDCFQGLDATAASAKVTLKPSAAAIEAAVGFTGFDPRRTLFVDDNERNIAAGKAVGLITALRAKTKEADYLLNNIHDLGRVVPQMGLRGVLKEEEEKEKEEEVDKMRSELGSIRPPPTPIQA